LTRHGLQLIVLTFLRTAELRAAEWSDIDLERREWRVPAQRMKMSNEHIVPLSTQAIDVLEAIRPITGHYRYIFTGRNSTARPVSENTLLYALYRMGYMRQATVHGFRATASTILNRAAFTVMPSSDSWPMRNATRYAPPITDPNIWTSGER